MAKKMYEDVGPVSNAPYDQGGDPGSGEMAGEHVSWKTQTQAVMGPVIAQPHEEVDEVHQMDEYFGMPSPSNTKQKN